MADHARPAEAWAQRRQDALAAVEDPMNDEDSDDNEEMGEAEKAFGPNRKQTNTISVYQCQVLWPIKKMVQC